MKRLVYRIGLAGVLALAAMSHAAAQQAHVNLDWNPQKNTQNLVPFGGSVISPEVRDDGMVTFRVRAPRAQEILLSAGTISAALGTGNKPVPFTKGEDGVWTLTIGPVPPNMYVYKLVIDGVAVPDPNNTLAGFADQPPYSQLVVHGQYRHQ
jgi:enterochelin esterase family protein